mmetsp:Transcript_27751/g.66063  ORF Transcript_27751/g.66063 Transcript_27751/m.66063 type:complete len:243 (+) Transcript_27751:1218-1946(+)
MLQPIDVGVDDGRRCVKSPVPLDGLVRRSPLDRPSRALGLLPVVPVQVSEESMVPSVGVGGPSTLEAGGDGILPLTRAVVRLPPHAKVLYGRALRLRSDVGVGSGAVGLAEGVPAGDEGDGLARVHSHAAEGAQDVSPRGLDIRVATWPLRVHVDQPHLIGAERFLELPSGVAVPLVLEPLLLDSPVHVGLRSEGVDPPASEPQRLDALEVLAHHALDRDVSGEYDEVGPGELRAVLLLDRP